MNFLQLVQFTAQWSGKAAATSITSVAAATTGVQLDIVNAVGHSWSGIQAQSNIWQWMRAEFSGSITAVVPPARASYTPASFGLTRFADYLYDQLASVGGGAASYYPMTLYNPAIGLADTQALTYIEWEEWRARYGRGLQQQGRPTEWSVDPSFNFCLGKAPDKPYTLNGEYFKGQQILLLDTDTPEMPANYHMLIVWRAALLLIEKDEADQLQYSRYEAKAEAMETQLKRDQVPRITIGGNPIA